MARTEYIVRRVRTNEIDKLVSLCAEHAQFERAPPVDISVLAARLKVALFAEPVRLYAWVVPLKDELVGYASVTPEFSTWSGHSYWHMDCLYVSAHLRGLGLGRHLMQSVCTEAAERNIMELQWQTPQWNGDAQRFYSRLGASMQLKARFTLKVQGATAVDAKTS
jgi:GNAT superfamily N-acetyltransferase